MISSTHFVMTRWLFIATCIVLASSSNQNNSTISRPGTSLSKINLTVPCTKCPTLCCKNGKVCSWNRTGSRKVPFCECPNPDFIGDKCECRKVRIVSTEFVSANSSNLEARKKYVFRVKVAPRLENNGKMLLHTFFSKPTPPEEFFPMVEDKGPCPQNETFYIIINAGYREAFDRYTLTVYLSQCMPVIVKPSNRSEILASPYLSRVHTETVIAKNPIAVRCLPTVRLHNVRDKNDTNNTIIPGYARNKEWSITKELTARPEAECDNVTVTYKYKWFLFLNHSDGSGKRQDLHINETNKAPPHDIRVSRYELHFDPFSLVGGLYSVNLSISVSVRGINRTEVAQGEFRIEMLHPEIHIEGGDKRSVDVFKEIVLNASRSVDPNYNNDPSRLVFTWTCANCPEGFKNQTGDTWVLPPSTLQKGQNYSFHLDVASTDHPFPKSDKTIILLGDGVNLLLECPEDLKGCNEELPPGQKLLLHCWCEGCDRWNARERLNFTFSWEPESDPIGFQLLSNTSYVNVILPHVNENDVRERAVVCKGPGGIAAKKDILISRPPKIGNCLVTPPEGIYLLTEFSLDCEEILDRSALSVSYSFYAEVEDRYGIGNHLENRYLLSHDSARPSASGVYLPHNQPSGSPTKILVHAVNSHGVSNFKTFSAIVKLPDPQDTSELLDKLVLDERSILNQVKDNGDFSKALQIQLVVLHGLLYDENIFQEIGPKRLAALRLKMTDVFSKVNESLETGSLKAVEQAVNTLYLWSKYDDSTTVEDAVDDLESNSNLLFQAASTLTKTLTEDRQSPIPTEIVEIIVRAGTDATARVLRQSVTRGSTLLSMERVRPKNERLVTDFDEEDDISRYYFHDTHGFTTEVIGEGDDDNLSPKAKQFARVSHNALLGLEHFLDAVGKRLPIGSTFAEKTDHIAVSSFAYMDIDKKGLPINVQTGDGEGVQVTVSGSLQEIMTDRNIKHVEIQLIESYDNPFFDDASAIISTPVVSLIIKDGSPDGDRKTVSLKEVQQPFEVRMPIRGLTAGVINASKIYRTEELRKLEDFDDSKIEPIYVILHHNIQWTVSVLDYPIGIEFSVAVRKDYWPTKHDFCDRKMSKILNPENKYSASFDTESLGLNEEPDEKFLEYFIGIYPYDVSSMGMHTHVNYSVYLTRTSCVYRNEDKRIWSEEGCVVGKDSIPTSIHCICDHASIFAGTQFAIPNSLPSLIIFDFKYEAFRRNPVVLTTVCVLVTLYILLMIICWIFDKRGKKRHVGITIMADVGGDPSQSYYLISVRTDSRFGAGTTANVCMQIYGSNGRSQVFTLKEKEMPVLNRGGSDTYLTATKTSLGEIEKIRIWHDNTGTTPTWFCRRVVVTDVQSNTEYYFYVYRWLHVSGSESTVVFEQNVAGEADHYKFSRRFMENVSDKLDNSHLWLSLLRFPASSLFTRCQRITCAFGILSAYLIMNIMFYGIELQDPDDLFGLQTYIVACQMSLMSAPIGIILIELFRRIRQRYIPTLIIWKNLSVRMRLQETDATIFVPQQKIPKAPVHRYPVFGDHNQTMMDRVTSAADRADSDASSNFSIPSTNIEDLENWLEFDVAPKMVSGSYDRTIFTRRVDEGPSPDDVNDHIAMGRLGLIRAVRAMDPSTFVFTGDNSIPEIERLIDQEIRDHLDNSRRPKAEARNFKLPPDMLPIQEIPDYHSASQPFTSDYHSASQPFTSDDQFFSDEDEEVETSRETVINLEPQPQTLTFETCEMAPVAKALCYLPWWFIYIAWVIAIGAIVTCLYFTLLFGLAYGYERSIDWLLGVVLSFFLSLLITQPIQVFVTSFFTTILCRSRKWSIIQEERFQILIKEEDDLGKRKPLEFRLFHPSRKYAPLSGHEILRLKVDARAREKMKNGLSNLFFYVLLLIPLSVVAHWGQGRNNFLLVDNLRNLLQLKDGQRFQAVNNNDDLYAYLKDILIPTLHPDRFYNGAVISHSHSRYDPVFLSDRQNVLVGVARIRQLRVVESKCKLPAYKCYGKYSIDKQDTASYIDSWKVKSKSSTNTSRFLNDNNVWKFKSIEKPTKLKLKKREFPFVPSVVQRGDLGNYYGGGYVAELGRTKRESNSVIGYLERRHWIDQGTRAVFIEFTVANPNVLIYTDVVLRIELGPSQAYECSYSINPVTRKLSRVVDDDGETHWLEVCYVAILLCSIALIANFIKNIVQFPDSSQLIYQKGLWVDFVTIGGLITCLGMAVKEQLALLDAVKLIEDMKVNQYVNLQELVFWSDLETAAFSVALSICFIKIFRILIHIDERFRVMALTLKMSGRMLGAYALFLFVVLIAFASSGHFLFGNEMREFRTFGHSIVSLIHQMVNIDFVDELSNYNRVLGPMYSLLFGFLVVFMSVNLLIAVLSQAHYEAKLVSREGQEEDSLLGNIRTVAGDLCSKPKKREQQKPFFELQPHRLEGMKNETVKFLEANLKSSQVRKLNEMKNHMNGILKGTGFRMVSSVCRRKKEELVKQENINKMRLITADFLRKKLGTEMTVQELRTYADTNREFMNLRVQKLEDLLELVNERLNDLLDAP